MPNWYYMESHMKNEDQKENIWNRRITIKANRLAILVLCTLLIVTIILCFTNGVENLLLKSIAPGNISKITVHEQIGDRTAELTDVDAHALCSLLKHISVRGRSVRLTMAEDFNPQFTVRFKCGISMNVACYDDHYIINGRGYPITDGHQGSFAAISRQYYVYISNRSYFPRETAKEG